MSSQFVIYCPHPNIYGHQWPIKLQYTDGKVRSRLPKRTRLKNYIPKLEILLKSNNRMLYSKNFTGDSNSFAFVHVICIHSIDIGWRRRMTSSIFETLKLRREDKKYAQKIFDSSSIEIQNDQIFSSPSFWHVLARQLMCVPVCKCSILVGARQPHHFHFNTSSDKRKTM